MKIIQQSISPSISIGYLRLKQHTSPVLIIHPVRQQNDYCLEPDKLETKTGIETVEDGTFEKINIDFTD